VVVLTNQDSVDTSGAIARKIASLLFLHDDASNEKRQSRAVLEGLQQGKIDRPLEKFRRTRPSQRTSAIEVPEFARDLKPRCHFRSRRLNVRKGV
jgi:hypothetical protein